MRTCQLNLWIVENHIGTISQTYSNDSSCHFILLFCFIMFASFSIWTIKWEEISLSEVLSSLFVCACQKSYGLNRIRARSQGSSNVWTKLHFSITRFLNKKAYDKISSSGLIMFHVQPFAVDRRRKTRIIFEAGKKADNDVEMT